jgi:uncharacterized alpha-E superfamily protein
MVRDTAYLFLDAGRRVERALHVLGLLHGAFAQAHPVSVEPMVAESILLAGESVITYRRRAAAGLLDAAPRAAASSTIELLLLDPANPRSVAYQLDRLDEALNALPLADGRADRTHDELLTDLRHTRAILREATPARWCAAERGGRRPVLARRLDEVSRNLRALSSLIENTYFRNPAPPRQLPSYQGRFR